MTIESEVIHGATPLECGLAGIHPRLYLREGRVEELRRLVAVDPYAGFLRRVLAQADTALAKGCPRTLAGGDRRGVGCAMPALAMAWLLTGQERYRAGAVEYLTTTAEYDDWGSSLTFGHLAHGFAVAYDWLYGDLDSPAQLPAGSAVAPTSPPRSPVGEDADPPSCSHRFAPCSGGSASSPTSLPRPEHVSETDLKAYLAERLRFHAERTFREWGGFGPSMSMIYAQNHMAVILCGLTAAGCALYGDVDGIAPWLRMATEKLHCMIDALGPDGVSPEGVAYGQYHVEFLTKTLILARELLGLDRIGDCEWFEQYPVALLHHTLPRNAWRGDEMFMMFGDAYGNHWYGPDGPLRFCASVFRNGHAQWLADAAAADGVNKDPGCFLNLVCQDSTVEAVPPDALPTFKHFADMDLAIMRSGWEGDASLFGFKCGPHAGHHAVRHYNHNVAGGHMHPNAGTVLLFTHGEWLLNHSGYARKQTTYANTLVVNGVGQTGEDSVWFEDVEIRKGRAQPCILSAEAGGAYDYVAGNVGPAYRDEAGLTRFVRHVLYLRPDVWIVIDDIEAQSPAAFELFFHTPVAAQPCDGREVEAHMVPGQRATLLVQTFATDAIKTRVAKQLIRGTSAPHPDREVDVLVVASAEPMESCLFVTCLHAHANNTAPSAAVSFDQTSQVLSVAHGDAELRLELEGQRGEALREYLKCRLRYS